MTWYPSYCQFFIGGPKKHCKKITRVSLVLASILPYCWNKHGESDKDMVEYIQDVLRVAGVKNMDAIVIKIHPWGFGGRDEKYPMAHGTECEAWCNFVGFSEDSEVCKEGLHSSHPIDESELESGELDEIIDVAYD